MTAWSEVDVFVEQVHDGDRDGYVAGGGEPLGRLAPRLAAVS